MNENEEKQENRQGRKKFTTDVERGTRRNRRGVGRDIGLMERRKR